MSKDSKKDRTFISKLASILRLPEYQEIIRWRDYNSFEILSVDRLEREVLVKFFRHSKYPSFVRQLNMYNFHKQRKDALIVFAHDHFNQATTSFQEPVLVRKKYTEKVQKNKVLCKESRRSIRKHIKIEQEEFAEVQPTTRSKRKANPSKAKAEARPLDPPASSSEKELSIDGSIQRHPPDLDALSALRNVSLMQLESENFAAAKRTTQSLISIRYLDMNSEFFHPS